MEVVIQKSKNKDKKYDAIIDNKRRISFGNTGYSDYTKHHDKERKQRYIDRHKKNENWGISGVKTAGFYSRWITWNKPTIKESVEDLNKKFKNLNVKLNNNK